MKPKPIGIIGGAGPLAAVSLQELIFCLARDEYNCWKDEDFPKVFVISFPFSDMLSPDMDASCVHSELKTCLSTLRNLGAEVIGIACNTLHAFLDPDEDLKSDLLQIPFLVKEEMATNQKPLILCTSTSARFALYSKYISCTYPDVHTQRALDKIITKILQGRNVLLELQTLVVKQPEDVIILGCTELSLYAHDLRTPSKKIIDPLSILARKITQKSFNGD